MKQVPPTNRGAALGAYAAFFDLGFAVAGPVTGALDYPAAFAVGGMSAIVAVLLTFYSAKNGSVTSPG